MFGHYVSIMYRPIEVTTSCNLNQIIFKHWLVKLDTHIYMSIGKIYIKKSYIGLFEGGVIRTLIDARDVQSQDFELISFLSRIMKVLWNYLE